MHDLAGGLVDGEDWGGRTVTGSFEGVTFLEVDMDELVTEGATFDGCTFKGVRLNGSRHTGSAFVSCTFQRTSLFRAAFHGCKLVGSTFDRCSFDVLSVEGGDWSFVSLSAAGLESARFSDVRLREADLSHVKGRGSTWTGCDLSAALLTGADLREADLRRADLSALDPTETRVAEALITLDQAVGVARGLGFDVRSD